MHSGSEPYFNQLEQNDDMNEDGNTDDINTEDDGTINNELVSNFDKSTGLWSYKSESTHKPMFSDDKQLHFYTRELSGISSTMTLMHTSTYDNR